MDKATITQYYNAAVKKLSALKDRLLGLFGSLGTNKTALAIGAGGAVVLLVTGICLFAFLPLSVSLVVPCSYAQSSRAPQEVYAAYLEWRGIDPLTVLSGSDISSADVAPSLSHSDLSGSDVSGSDLAEESFTIALKLRRGCTVADALAAAGISPDDQYLHTAFSPEQKISRGMVIELRELIRVYIAADGVTTELIADVGTVGDVLSASDVILGENDRVSPSAETRAQHEMTITVSRVVIAEETEEVEVPYSTVRQDDGSLFAGTEQLATAGVNGKKLITYRCVYVDGQPESRESIREEVTLEPVDEVILVGTKATTTKPTTPSTKKTSGGKRVVSKEAVYDCDGSGRGYYIITYSDGSVVYQDF